MRSYGLVELDAVLAIARHGSFRVAAVDLGMSRPAVSHAISQLEGRLGVRLFHRTTRSVALTEAGRQFVEDIAPALSDIREAFERVGTLRETPSGTLRINSSAGAAKQVMTPIFVEYLRRFPDMRIDLVTEGRLVDIVLDGFDAGVRLLQSVPQDMIAVPFGQEQRFKVVGSPSYLEKHGKPQSPEDLSAHRCIRSRMPGGAIYRWEFERNGDASAYDGSGPLLLGDPELMLQAARAGLGLAYLSDFNVAADLDAGTLVAVLEDWTPPFPGLALYYPGRRQVPAGLRAMIELIRESARSSA
jgi:DNA-binding transcriptional LysR family regulator